jgi:hypothetical protein
MTNTTDAFVTSRSVKTLGFFATQLWLIAALIYICIKNGI